MRLVLGARIAERLARDPTPSATGTRYRSERSPRLRAARRSRRDRAPRRAHRLGRRDLPRPPRRRLRAPAKRRWPYLVGTLTSALFVFALTPFVESIGSHPLWAGPTIPVLGQLDVTTEELRAGLYQALRLAAVGLAFADYALLVDHDRLLAVAGWARRSALAVALATRLVPTLERDARDMQLALRGRGVERQPGRA